MLVVRLLVFLCKVASTELETGDSVWWEQLSLLYLIVKVACRRLLEFAATRCCIKATTAVLEFVTQVLVEL